MYEDSGHAEVSGNCTCVLSSSSSEAGQDVMRGVVPLSLQRREGRGGEGREGERREGQGRGGEERVKEQTFLERKGNIQD